MVGDIDEWFNDNVKIEIIGSGYDVNVESVVLR